MWFFSDILHSEWLKKILLWRWPVENGHNQGWRAGLITSISVPCDALVSMPAWQTRSSIEAQILNGILGFLE